MKKQHIVCDRLEFHCGDHIDNDYKVEKLLGAGTFGCVYKVEGSDGTPYALKLLKLWEIPSDERAELLKRFDMEYDTGHIESKYLVHSYAKGEVGGNPYIIMEFCPCGDLMTTAEKGSVDFTAVGHDVLYGLRDLHRRGKVHRDLKPENVLIKQDGSAVLTDFGISGDQNNRLTQRGIFGVPQQQFGTFPYMPPEQINPRRGNATVLPTTDIFSFGVMMYQLITYELPFGDCVTEADLPRYIDRGKRGLWNRELLHRTSIGKQWEGVIEGCLVPNFKERLQNVDEVLKLMPPPKEQNAYTSAIHDSHDTWGNIRNGVALHIMQGEQHGTKFYLDNMISGGCRVLTMGRLDDGIENRIPIKDTINGYISRCHCTLEQNAETRQWLIRDGQWRNRQWKSSMNGTYVNSTEIDRNGILLHIGDIITIGDVKLRVEGF
ncbi:protein kinase [Prevotella sp. PINT]|jgi:Serine/threonine protein kinase|nr:protein kinase [Palleniella intestinalis]